MKRKRLLISFLSGIFIISPLVFANQDLKSLDEGITSSQENKLSVETQLQVPIGPSCEGNNHENNSFLDNVSMGGPVVGISWIPTHSVTITHIEVFTGETTGPVALAIWSDDGGSPSKPLSNLGNTSYITINLSNSWQGANLLTPVTVTAGTKYWVVFDPNGGEQSPVQNPGIQQTYWGSYSGDVTGGTSWFGPFSSYGWKFRMMCSGKCLGLVCTIIGTNGTSGDDVICGTDNNDIIWAKEGNDTVCGGKGDDVLIGGQGHDRLDGGPGNDILNGGKGRDMLDGGLDNDVLLGKAGHDMLFGGSGYDYIEGSRGNDLLNGGPDHDVCENRETVINCESIGSLFLYGGTIPPRLQTFIELE